MSVYVFWPTGETATQLLLQGTVTEEDLKTASPSAGYLRFSVSEGRVFFSVHHSKAEKVFVMLKTGECVVGFNNTPIYNISSDIEVNVSDDATVYIYMSAAVIPVKD